MPKANNHVVGYSTVNNVDSRVHAFLSDGNVMKDLNTLIGAATEKYHLNSAMAINDNGQIVASALSKATGTRRAVLLKPISPLPSR